MVDDSVGYQRFACSAVHLVPLERLNGMSVSFPRRIEQVIAAVALLERTGAILAERVRFVIVEREDGSMEYAGISSGDIDVVAMRRAFTRRPPLACVG